MSKQYNKSVFERFMYYVVLGGECWQWIGAKHHGYGRIAIGKGLTPKMAHRFSYEHFVGPIPTGMLVRHKCDNPLCVRPDHLELGTQSDNIRDREERGRGNHHKKLENLIYWSEQRKIHGNRAAKPLSSS